MIEIVWDEGFKRLYKKWDRKHPDLISIFAERILLFEKNPFDASFKTHILGGKLKNIWAFSINYEHRLTFRFEENNTKAILVKVGTHDEVY
jgi:mRNA-degrading endonuclease YafQ of YafQ-DinJ toxin-antitoxin module